MARALSALAVLFCALPFVAVAETPNGHLVLLGGGERPAYVMDRIAELAGGPEARVLVLPLANPEPEEAGAVLKQELERSGAGRVEVLDLDPEALDRWETLERVNQASGVFFAGGDPARLAAALRGTALSERVRDLYRRGGVVAGSSAGASVLGSSLVTGPARPNQDPDRAVGAIRAGSVKIEPGLGLLEGVIVDQHFLARRRHNRLLTALLEGPERLALGLDEATAIVVGPPNHLEVLGDSLVAIYDLGAAGAAEADARGNLAVSGIVLHLLPSGGRFDLERRSVVP